MSIRGIKIQGDYGYPPNYIKKFQLRYSTDGTNFLYKTSDAGMSREVCINFGMNHYSFCN